MPEISIIMATYNCEETLRRAIDSILAQTFTDWEFVICDDCSTDGTFAILQDYQRRFPEKFVILRNEVNSKLPFSLNHCLKNARGKFIARMDGDDLSCPERLARQREFLLEHPELQVCGTSMMRFDENGEYDLYQAVRHPDRFTLLHQVPFCHATILMRKEAYDALGGYVVSPRTERGQDLDLWFRFYAAGYAGDNLEEPLYKVCEDRAAIRRRKFKYSVYVAQTRRLGFKLLNYPKRYWYLIYTPILSFFVPRWIKLLRQQRKRQ